MNLLWAISCVLGLVYDCKSFLGGLGVCLDQRKCLNCTVSLISDYDFSLGFWKLLWPFERVLGRELDWKGLHIC